MMQKKEGGEENSTEDREPRGERNGQLAERGRTSELNPTQNRREGTDPERKKRTKTA